MWVVFRYGFVVKKSKLIALIIASFFVLFFKEFMYNVLSLYQYVFIFVPFLLHFLVVNNIITIHIPRI